MKFFSLLFFSVFLLCYLCLYLCLLFFFYYFSFALLIVIGTAKQQRAHIIKASNINNIITITSWRNQHTEFSENYLNYLNYSNYLELSRVTLSTCNTQDNFCFISEPLSSQSSNFFVALLNYLIKCNYRLHKTNRSYLHIFSMGLEFAFSKFFEKDFCT